MEHSDNTHLLNLARLKSITAASRIERLRWLLVVAMLEGSQCPKPGSSTPAKAS